MKTSPATRASKRRTPVVSWRDMLLLPHLASLDATIVAIVWQELIAQSFGTPLTLVDRGLLFAAVWLAYAGDRWLDSGRLDPDLLAPRHSFARRHRRPLGCVLFATLITVLIGGWVSLSPDVRLVAFSLGAAAFAYVLGTWWRPSIVRRLLMREFVVGSLLATGVFFAAWFRSGDWPIVEALVAYFCVAGLFTLNALVVARQERRRDLLLGEDSAATRWRSFRRGCPKALLFAACGGYLAAIFLLPLLRELCLAAVLSILLLYVLDCRPRSTFGPLLADFALLTPCLFIAS